MSDLIQTAVQPTKASRLPQLDALRGFIIVVMALDHANSFIANGKMELELWADIFPTYRGHPPLTFITRLVTHLAAPGFFFLMGAGMALFALSRRRQGWGEGKIASHFLLRGGLLILFQFLLENPAWSLKSPSGTYFGVLYGLGGAMVVGILFLRLPQNWLLALSGALIIVTQALLPEARTGFVTYPVPLRLWFLPGFTESLLVLYPVMPWLGVVGLGMGYGRFLHKCGIQNAKCGMKLTFWAGTGALILFVGLRQLGGYGNIRPSAGDDWVAFLNVVKYPPSIVFLLLTLGVDWLLLALFARLPEGWLRPFTTFGRVPFFFYIAHLYLYGLMGRVIHADIPGMYPYWLLGLGILWPLCWAYGRFKDGRSPNSLWRFL
ncbi:MAG: DUF1624 domain-containing protein [Chloroflexi bacterium]|nr:DUF1624 domain-containing protein [Chloroflexota bacterium]